MGKMASILKFLSNSEELMSQETIERSFEVGSPARVKLGNIRGEIDIQSGEDGLVSITAIKHLDSGDEQSTQIKIDQEEDGRVIVKTEFANSIENLFGLRKPCKVDYTVRLPKVCELNVSGVSCTISVEGLDGSISISTVSGDLKAQNLSGKLKFSAVSGSITAEGLQGELDANGVSGSLRIVESKLAKAFAKTVSGKTVLQTPLSEGPYSFKGVSGKTVLVIPEDAACTARFHSVSGRMRTSLPITRDNRAGSRGSVEIQGGGVEVSCKSVSGAFRIVKAENETIKEEIVQVENPEPKVDRMEVLQKIERGEISVDEGLKEMNA
jgi:hypothetical protein